MVNKWGLSKIPWTFWYDRTPCARPWALLRGPAFWCLYIMLSNPICHEDVTESPGFFINPQIPIPMSSKTVLYTLKVWYGTLNMIISSSTFYSPRCHHLAPNSWPQVPLHTMDIAFIELWKHLLSQASTNERLAYAPTHNKHFVAAWFGRWLIWWCSGSTNTLLAQLNSTYIPSLPLSSWCLKGKNTCSHLSPEVAANSARPILCHIPDHVFPGPDETYFGTCEVHISMIYCTCFMTSKNTICWKKWVTCDQLIYLTNMFWNSLLLGFRGEAIYATAL